MKVAAQPPSGAGGRAAAVVDSGGRAPTAWQPGGSAAGRPGGPGRPVSCEAGAGGARQATTAPSPSPTCHTRSPAAQLAGLSTLPAPQPITLGGQAPTLIDAGRSAHGVWGRSPAAPRPAAAILSLVSVGCLPAVSGAGSDHAPRGFAVVPV